MGTTEIVFRNANGVPVTTSYLIAETFGKAHRGVLRDIDNLVCSEDFQVHNFVQMFKIRELPNGGNTQDRYFVITKDGFTFLAMGYTGKKAAEFKEKYIAAFNAMSDTLRQMGDTSTLIQSQQMLVQQMSLLANQIEAMNKTNALVLQRLERLEQTTARRAKAKEDPVIITVAAPSTPKRKPDYRDRHVYSYKQLRRRYPDYRSVNQTVGELRERGIRVYRRTLCAWLYENGYLEENDEYYNLPSKLSAEKGWIVAIRSSSYPHTGETRKRYTPYLSPLMMDILEDAYRHRLQTRQLQLEMKFGKEVQP